MPSIKSIVVRLADYRVSDNPNTFKLRKHKTVLFKRYIDPLSWNIVERGEKVGREALKGTVGVDAILRFDIAGDLVDACNWFKFLQRARHLEE